MKYIITLFLITSFATAQQYVAQKIDALTGGGFLEATYKDKRYALYQILDYLYSKQQE